MKIVIDDKIPYIRGAFEPVAEVLYLPGSKTNAEVVQNADAIVTRTRTICNEELLAGSSVKFIATATIGYDHIDTGYCKQAGIAWTNAPGCNSGSVEQYIASVLMVLSVQKEINLQDLCIGIVGVGNVGSKIERLCRILGMKVLLNDPPREKTEGSAAFVSIETIQKEADIISLHVPLESSGEYATWHMADESFFYNLKRKPVLINSCRGEVVKTSALKMALDNGSVSAAVCDCWENEPEIDRELLDACFIATPHIAGYSRDGKANGTKMSVQAISKYLELGLDNWQPTGVELPDDATFTLNGQGLSEFDIIAKAIFHTFDVRNDDNRLRNDVSSFEKQRGDYPVRREFHAFTIIPENIPDATIEKLKMLRFNIKN